MASGKKQRAGTYPPKAAVERTTVRSGKGKGQGSGGGVRQETPGITRLGALEGRRAVQPVPNSPKPGSGNRTLPWYIGCDGEHAGGCAGSWAFSLGCSGSG